MNDMRISFPAGTVLFIFLWLVSLVIVGVPGFFIAGESFPLQVIVQQVALFLVPALLFAYYAYHDFWNDFGLKKAGKISDYNWFILLYALTLVLAAFLGEISETLPFPESWVEASKRSEALTHELVFGILSGGTFANLMFALFVMAVVPAICEEVFFRGVVQTNIAKRTGNMHLAVWCSAVFFSAIHFEILGFLPRILMGAAFGYAFVLTKSLWVPIILHFLNNGVLVLVYFSYLNGLIELNPFAPSTSPVPIWLVVACLVAGIALLKFLLKHYSSDAATTKLVDQL